MSRQPPATWLVKPAAPPQCNARCCRCVSCPPRARISCRPGLTQAGMPPRAKRKRPGSVASPLPDGGASCTSPRAASQETSTAANDGDDSGDDDIFNEEITPAATARSQSKQPDEGREPPPPPTLTVAFKGGFSMRTTRKLRPTEDHPAEITHETSWEDAREQILAAVGAELETKKVDGHIGLVLYWVGRDASGKARPANGLNLLDSEEDFADAIKDARMVSYWTALYVSVSDGSNATAQYNGDPSTCRYRHPSRVVPAHVYGWSY
jgi:hypothetical protein